MSEETSKMAANPNFQIILGSSSMARREILKEMGYDFTIMTADIDEKSIRRDKPEDLVVTLAEAKIGIADGVMGLSKSLTKKLLEESLESS